MHIQAIATSLVTAADDIFAIVKKALPSRLPEKTIVAIASKIPATCEGRFVPKTTGTKEEKHALVMAEAERYLPASTSKYQVMLTIKQNWMFANAGIDESNANGHYLLWPKNPQATTEAIWQWLRDEYQLSSVGVILTDSRSIPLSWGVVGHAIGYCGFNPLFSYVDKPDLFGRKMQMEKINIAQSLAGVASIAMGEGAEQTPIALFTDLPDMVQFSKNAPSAEELQDLVISLEDDIYAPLLTAVEWKKGGSGK